MNTLADRRPAGSPLRGLALRATTLPLPWTGTGTTRRPWQLLAAACTIALLALSLLAPLPLAAPAPTQRTLQVDARSFEYTPSILHVNRGDTVAIKLSSEDVVHGLYVDGYGLSVTAEPGQPGELRFVADHEGGFHIRCSVPCGSLHPFMIGKLIVGPNLMWLRAVLASIIATLGALFVFWKW